MGRWLATGIDFTKDVSGWRGHVPVFQEVSVENIGFSELMLILVVVLLLFGAKRLPEVGSSIGKGIREFKRSLSDIQDTISNHPNEGSPASHQSNDPGLPAPTQGKPKRLSQ
jgi:sec-independent protein translocase protein TatA